MKTSPLPVKGFKINPLYGAQKTSEWGEGGYHVVTRGLVFCSAIRWTLHEVTLYAKKGVQRPTLPVTHGHLNLHRKDNPIL